MAAPLLLSPVGALAQSAPSSHSPAASVARRVAASSASSASPAVGASEGAAEGTQFNVSIDGAGTFATSLPPSSVATYVLPSGGQSVKEWLTTPDGQVLGDALTPQPAIALGTSTSGATIAVNPGQRAQTMLGFGAAMTDSAASLINTSQSRAQIMNDLFGESGARFTMVRLPMGATDLESAHFQSYDDTANDTSLTHFSVAHDTQNIIPLLQEAKGLQPDLRILAAPWSAPGWMKVDGTFDGTCPGEALSNAVNTLKPSDYAAYAQYFVKFVQAYQNTYDLPIYMVSMQNEPENCNSTYPTMNMTEPDEVAFGADLRAAFNKAHLSTKILGFDHNWYYEPSPGTSVPDPYPAKLVAAAGDDINAIGYHCYDGGEPTENPNAFESQVPYSSKLAVLMTECSGFNSSPDTAGNLVNEVHYDLIGPIRNSASTSLYWSLAMNSTGGPHSGGCSNCRGMVTIDSPASGDFTLSQDYYYWAQFSEFVDPGAVVIGSTYQAGEIESVAFQNPGGSIVVVVLNKSPENYVGQIVQWGGDTKAQKTSWLVGPDGHRRWINNIATYNCLRSNGAPAPDVLNADELDALPDLTNVWAVCGVDRIGVNSMLQTGFYLRSQNGEYTLKLTAGHLALYETASPGDVLWQTNEGGGDLILQSDGNLVLYDGSTAVWESGTVGSGAAWLVLGDDGKLALYNQAGNYVWTNEGPPSQYVGHIVQWEGDTKAQKTAWLVGPDGERRWISNISTYNCLKSNGAPGPNVLTSWELNQMPDLTNVWAVCGADSIGVNSMLQQGFYARSLNGTYTLRLTGSNLTLTDSDGNVLWQTGQGGDDLILQPDGNLVEYAGGTAVWSSNTVGSGAAWLVVNNDGSLELYNGAGSPVWTSVDPAAYVGHIVEWVNGGGQPNTSWIVSSNGERYWIPNTSTYSCMVNIGFSDLGPQSPGILNALPDSGQWARCPVSAPTAQDTVSVGQGLFQGESITSLNGEYTLILQQDHNLVLYGPSGALWATNTWTGGYVIMQSDGNFVGYSMWDNPQWSTGTGGAGTDCALVVQNDANLVLYCGGVAKWDRYSGRLY